MLGVTTEGLQTVYAFNVGKKALEVEVAGDATLEMWTFRTPLQSLGLVEHELRVDPNGDALPAPARVFKATLEDDTVSSWAEASGPSAELVSFRTTRVLPNACDRLDIEVLALTSTVPAAAAITMPDGRAWIAMEDTGQFFVFDGAVMIEADVEPKIDDIADLAIAPDGTLVVAGTDSTLYEGRPTGTTLRLTQSTTRSGMGRMSRIVIADDGTTYAMNRLGGVFVVGSTIAIYNFDHLESTNDIVLYADGNVIYASSELSATIVRLRPGVAPQRLAIPSFAGAISITRTAELGIVVGTTDSEIFRVADDHLVELGLFDFFKARTLLPWGDSLMVTGNTGAIGIYEDGTTCDTGLQTVEDLAVGAAMDGISVYAPTSSGDRVRAGGMTPVTIVR